MANETIRENVNKLCVLKVKAENIKREMDEIEAFFLKQAENDLKDTKIKTVSYTGDMGNSVSATMAATVKLEHPTLLKKAFGSIYSDLVKEEIKYNINANAKRILGGVFLGDYTKETLKGILGQIGIDEKAQSVLAKKIKGINFKKDAENIATIGGISEKEARYYAYFATEALVWEKFIKLLEASGKNTQVEIDKCLKLIDTAIIVEETPKIAIEAIN